MEVSIITINYNSSVYTLKLLSSILKKVSDKIEYEIIIIDNASEKNDYKNLIDKSPKDSRIKIVRSDINTGFSGGNMQGYKESSGKYLLFMNNDCECLNDILSPLLKFIKTRTSLGLLTALVFGEDGKSSGTHKLFPCLTKSIFGTKFSRLCNKERFISPKVLIDRPTKVEIVTGAFMFFDKNVFEDIGGFDTNFFLYCEEEDICKRVWDKGKDVYMIPEARVLHHGGGSEDVDTDISIEYYISYKKLIYKHYNFIYAFFMIALTYLKLTKKVFYMKTSLSLVKIALMGFPDRYSLRYKQKVRKY